MGSRVVHPPPLRNLHLRLEKLDFVAISYVSVTAFASGLPGVFCMNLWWLTGFFCLPRKIFFDRVVFSRLCPAPTSSDPPPTAHLPASVLTHSKGTVREPSTEKSSELQNAKSCSVFFREVLVVYRSCPRLPGDPQRQ